MNPRTANPENGPTGPGGELASRLAAAGLPRRALDELLASQRQIEDALRASETLLNTTGEIARIGGWELELPRLALRWTEQTFRLHGLAPAASRT